MSISMVIKSAVVSAMLSTGYVPEMEIQETYCMAEAVFFEAANQRRKGKEAVANVIKNRTEDPCYPPTICQVVRQRGQFSYHRTNKLNYKFNPDNKDQADQLAASAIVALLATSGRLRDNTGGATAFANPNVATDRSWLVNMRKVAVIEDHTFYVPKKQCSKI